MPNLEFESLHDGIVCGIDEAGRGPLAGPVVAAAVVVPDGGFDGILGLHLNDSKKLSVKRRDQLYPMITEHAVAYGIGFATPREIDEINILNATFLAMKRAFLSLAGVDISVALVDGNRRPALPCDVQTLVKGDSRSVSIAAASVLAKVVRDREMERLAEEHPEYGWTRNSGYPTKDHIEALRRFGPTPHHRLTFGKVLG